MLTTGVIDASGKWTPDVGGALCEFLTYEER
jgi:hypothetical protein